MMNIVISASEALQSGTSSQGIRKEYTPGPILPARLMRATGGCMDVDRTLI